MSINCIRNKSGFFIFWTKSVRQSDQTYPIQNQVFLILTLFKPKKNQIFVFLLQLDGLPYSYAAFKCVFFFINSFVFLSQNYGIFPPFFHSQENILGITLFSLNKSRWVKGRSLNNRKNFTLKIWGQIKVLKLNNRSVFPFVKTLRTYLEREYKKNSRLILKSDYRKWFQKCAAFGNPTFAHWSFFDSGILRNFQLRNEESEES